MSQFVTPAYHARSLGDVVPAAVHALGLGGVVGPAPSDLTLPDASAYVIFLVDGLGAELLQRYSYSAPFLADHLAHQRPGTAGVPSTTVTSLTSLGTGLTPGEHGMVGYTSRNPDTEKLLNALNWDTSVDPEQWQPHPTVFQRLAQAGVTTSVVNKSAFAHSGLTRSAHRGGDFVGADDADARIAAVVAASSQRPSLTYVYDSALDSAGHKFGVASTEWLQQLDAIDEEAERMREALPDDVRMLVVADHGMIDCPPQHHLDIDQHLSLRSGVELLGGEARFRHLYTRPGAAADVAATWREVLRTKATVLTRDEAVRAGWFGALNSPMAPRVGDVVVAAHGTYGFFSSADFAYEMTLIGLHGSLTSAEMSIPILIT